MLRHAEALAPCLVEADLHLRRGRIEVRHLKTMGPLPLLWDRWQLAPGWRPRLPLGALLAAAGPATELMLDLKGRDLRLARRLADALADVRRPSRITVCSRNWALLEALEGLEGVRRVHSVGSRRQLRALRRRFAGRRLEGISIHRDLLDAGTVADLRTRADMVMTWPVASADEARALAGWGVNGVITERFDALVPALAHRSP